MELASKFCQIVESEHKRMVSIMRGRLKKSPSLAEDMLQAAYLHIWQYIHHTAMPADKLTVGFVINVAVQRYIDYIRFRHNNPTDELPDEDVRWGDTCERCLGLEDEVVERFEQQERRTLVYRRIGEMTTDYRAVVLLRLRGWEYKRISERLHIPLGTVKSRLNYATKHLSKWEPIKLYKSRSA